MEPSRVLYVYVSVRICLAGYAKRHGHPTVIFTKAGNAPRNTPARRCRFRCHPDATDAWTDKWSQDVDWSGLPGMYGIGIRGLIYITFNSDLYIIRAVPSGCWCSCWHRSSGRPVSMPRLHSTYHSTRPDRNDPSLGGLTADPGQRQPIPGMTSVCGILSDSDCHSTRYFRPPQRSMTWCTIKTFPRSTTLLSTHFSCTYTCPVYQIYRILHAATNIQNSSVLGFRNMLFPHHSLISCEQSLAVPTEFVRLLGCLCRQPDL